MREKSKTRKSKSEKKLWRKTSRRKLFATSKKLEPSDIIINKEHPVFALSNTIQPVIDLSTSLSNAIKPLQAAQQIFIDRISPTIAQTINLSENFPNLSSINSIFLDTLKPIQDLKFTLDATTKPFIDFATQVNTSLKPLTDIGINFSENFPNFSATKFLVADNLKPITDFKIKLDEATKPLVDFASQIDTTLKPFNIINHALDEQLKPIAENILKIEDTLKPLTEFKLDLPNVTPNEFFLQRPLINFVTNFDAVSNTVNKDLLGSTLSYYNPEELAEVEEKPKKSKKKKINQLIKKLTECIPGKDWKEYENICEEILSYCLLPELLEPISQSETSGAEHIRDIIYNIPHEADEFWKYIMLQFGMAMIVECKNYAKPIKENNVVITSKYFGKKKLTTFGLIISRKKLENSGKKGQSNAWIHDDKMIICLSDDDLIKMLEFKEKHEKPWKVIDNALREFRQSL